MRINAARPRTRRWRRSWRPPELRRGGSWLELRQSPRQLRHYRVAIRRAGAAPAGDFVEGAAAAFAPAGGVVDHADVDARAGDDRNELDQRVHFANQSAIAWGLIVRASPSASSAPG